jgi:hypothetical protein
MVAPFQGVSKSSRSDQNDVAPTVASRFGVEKRGDGKRRSPVDRIATEPAATRRGPSVKCRFSRDRVEPRLRQFEILVSRLDETHFNQSLQLLWINRRQLQTLRVDIAKGPTQGNRFFKSDMSERVLAIGHRKVPVGMDIRITKARMQ